MSTSTLATDRLDIAAVLARHAYAVDHQDAALLRETVTPDARLASPLDALHPDLGVDDLLALSAGPTTTRTRETVLRGALVTLAGDTATSVGELGFVELELLADGGAVRRQIDATAIDSLVRTPEGWRLAARRLHLADADVAAVTVPADRRPLIEQGASILADAAYLSASAPATGGPASELLDIEAALALHGLARATSATKVEAGAGAGALSSRQVVSNVKAVVEGDRASAESEFIRTTLTASAGGGILRRRTSGVELTELERGSAGWTIVARTEFLKSDAKAPAVIDDELRERIVAGSAALRALEAPHPTILGPVSDDRLAIRETLVRYSSVFDQERWDLVTEVFTPDADFGGEGAGPSRFVDGARAFYADRLTGLHSIADPVLRIEGDRAWAYTDFTTIAIHDPADGLDDHLDRLRSGGFYVDELRRTDAGWRISARQVAYSSSVRDTITGGADLRESIARTRSRLADSPAFA